MGAKAYGIPDVVADERFPFNGRFFGPDMFGFQVGDYLGLDRFLQGHRFEMEIGLGGIEAVDQL